VNLSSVLAVLAVLAAGVTLAALTYLRLERTSGRVMLPLTARAVAWAALGLLLLNVGCPRPPVARRPLVLLDGSLSMAAAGGRWGEVQAVAARLGDVRTFGDERPATDSLPTRGRSLLAPALAAASASDRPVIVVTDGEIEDSAALAPDLLAGAAVHVLPRAPGADVALTDVAGPARVTAGDTLRLEADVRAFGGAPDSAAIEVLAGRQRLLRKAIKPFRAGRLELIVPTIGLAAGSHVLTLRLTAPGDREPRDDERLHLITVAATPGIVLLAAPGDWDSRFLFRTIRDVAELPVRGYVQVEPGAWRSMRDLSPVSTPDVRHAAEHADLLVVKGSAGALVPAPTARGIWLWPSGETGETLLPGDWYLSAGNASPVAGAFAGEPVDSFPPAIRITPVQPAPDDWVALTARENRRGAERPVVLGRSSGQSRRVTVAADGLWRWAFRGGSSEQVYRSWVAATTSWLLAGADSSRGLARPVRGVVQNGRPLIFEWVAGGTPRDLAVTWSGPTDRADTLRFDGSGRAVTWLPVGTYRYRLGGGGGGTVAVETYSDEWLPAPTVLADHPGRPSHSPGRTSARDWPWLFAVLVLALTVEWMARRRLGLR
jgi:hypothetical protein